MSEINEAIKAVGNAVIEQKDFLTDLDRAIGDGDHGINMARGFKAVFTKIDALPDDVDLATILKTIGMGLISSVGGAAGPLYGTAFMRAGKAVKGKVQITNEDIINMLNAAIQGIQDRGKATQGEKTMLDALMPARDIFVKDVQENKSAVEALGEAVKAATKGVEFTKTIIATKGRASYVGERSIGHQDPGATSSTIMLKALYEFYTK